MNDLRKKMKITEHFYQRYLERILCVDIDSNLSKKYIKDDLLLRMSDIEKNIFDLFSCKENEFAKIPLSGTHSIVLKNGYLITVY